MNLGNRETAARRDAQLRGAEAFMAGELDDAHLLAEHRATCDETVTLHHRSPTDAVMRRLADVVDRLNVAMTCSVEIGGASQVLHAVEYALNGPRKRDDDDWLRVNDRQALALVRALLPYVTAARSRPGCEGCSTCLPSDDEATP